MEDFLQAIQQRWGAMRILRMALSLIILYDGLMSENYWIIAFGGFFAYQALANKGCGSCNINGQCAPKHSSSAGTEDIEYEEVK